MGNALGDAPHYRPRDVSDIRQILLVDELCVVDGLLESISHAMREDHMVARLRLCPMVRGHVEHPVFAHPVCALQAREEVLDVSVLWIPVRKKVQLRDRVLELNAVPGALIRLHLCAVARRLREMDHEAGGCVALLPRQFGGQLQTADDVLRVVAAIHALEVCKVVMEGVAVCGEIQLKVFVFPGNCISISRVHEPCRPAHLAVVLLHREIAVANKRHPHHRLLSNADPAHVLLDLVDASVDLGLHLIDPRLHAVGAVNNESDVNEPVLFEDLSAYLPPFLFLVFIVLSVVFFFEESSEHSELLLNVFVRVLLQACFLCTRVASRETNSLAVRMNFA
mmetsp:Transcript_41640/g.98735  ORF Transcript_41640/g.98735 Transcript_41640/m.98735 type:complete len:337 (-) Transcript_41640:549-1559(-)